MEMCDYTSADLKCPFVGGTPEAAVFYEAAAAAREYQIILNEINNKLVSLNVAARRFNGTSKALTIMTGDAGFSIVSLVEYNITSVDPAS